MRRMLILGLLLAAITTTGCFRRARSHVVYGGQIPLEVVNDLGNTVCFVYMGPSTERSWGTDWLGRREVLNHGQSRQFGIFRPVPWDIRVTDCNGQTLAEARGLPLQGPSRILLGSMTLLPLGATPAQAAPDDQPTVVSLGAVHPVYTTRVTDAGEARAVVTGDRIEINQRILFESASARILEESTPILTQLAGALTGHPEIRRVRIEGHTDVRGSEESNQQLSQDRAESVVAWLRGAGVSQELEHVGYGESRPLCSDDVEDCHQRNRRVDFVILERDAMQATVQPAASTVERALSPACVEGLSPSGTSYIVCNLETNQPGARRSCREVGYGWDLATLRDGQEQAFVNQITASAPGGSADRWYWIANNDLFREGRYAWGDNTPAPFVNWCEGEPNNSGGVEDCVHYWPNDCGGRWNDVSCNSSGPWTRANGTGVRSGFLCERRADTSAADGRRRAEYWQAMFQRWPSTGPGGNNPHLAACAATLFMQECGGSTVEATLACIHQRRPELTAMIGQRCVQYGGLATSGLPNELTQLQPSNDAQLRGFNAEFADCVGRVNAVDRYLSDSVDYTCACITSWIVDACLAAPGASPETAGSCVQAHAADFDTVGAACLHYGHLRIR